MLLFIVMCCIKTFQSRMDRINDLGLIRSILKSEHGRQKDEMMAA